MLIAKILEGAVTDVADYRAMFPSTVFPAGGPTDEWLAANSCMRVNVFKAFDRLTQIIEPAAPYIEGEWVYTVQVREMTSEEIQAAKDSAMAQLRADRNALLAATDWRFRSDLTPSQEWKDYCQTLRDFPATVSDARLPVEWPHNPDWVEPTI